MIFMKIYEFWLTKSCENKESEFNLALIDSYYNGIRSFKGRNNGKKWCL